MAETELQTPFVAIPEPTISRWFSRKQALILAIAVSCVVAVSATLIGVAVVRSSAIHDPYARTMNTGIVVPIPGGFVELAVQGNSSFRVSVSYDGLPTQISTPMIADQNVTAPYTVISSGAWFGIRTLFGSVRVNNVTNSFEMYDANGNVLTSTQQFASYESSVEVLGNKATQSTCNTAHTGYDVNGASRTPACPNGLGGMTQATCCQACDNDHDCTVWVFALPGSESQGKNCWLLMGKAVEVHAASNRVTGGDVSGITAAIHLNLGKSTSSKFYGAGCGADDSQKISQTQSTPKVVNTAFYTPHFYSSDGYSALGVSSLDYTPRNIYYYPAGWDATSSEKVSWNILGNQADLYLTPSTNGLGEGLSKYWDLIGRPVVPPRYAFGFIACRWGWKDVNYINDMLSQFRNGEFPIDAWISDFEWYTPQPDYAVPDEGLDSFVDFGYNAVTFPDPTNNIKNYHDNFHLRFGGIRKPRLGNKGLLEMAKSKGWTVSADHSSGAPGGPRNLNYSVPELREWYSSNHDHFLPEGVDFWWNDEGETFYFAFHWWNEALTDNLNRFNPRKRYFSINRSYTPGMQRQGSAQWTGDISQSWQSMQQQPGYLINWNLAGSAYVTADTGGFNGGSTTPLMLARWYQVSAFTPLMRVHSNLQDVPHFPFLWGDEAAASMRLSLNLRYKFIPYHYSLAHHMYRPNGLPMFRPMAMAFPSDSAVSETTSQWMDGDSVLVCPVMRDDNTTSCYLPKGDWYSFGTNYRISGPNTQQLTSVSLNSIPLYVKAGSIVPQAPLVQYSDLLPGGPLELQVYPGADATFTLVEDDGETTDYSFGATRDTFFSWTDSTRTLTWTPSGYFKDEHCFAQMKVTVYLSQVASSAALDLTNAGKISF